MSSATYKQVNFIKRLHRQNKVPFVASELEDMTRDQADAKIKSMLGDLPPDPRALQRSKLISMARTIGWELSGKVDIEKLDSWCVKYGMFHKPLNSHTLQQLPHLLTQFKNGPFRHELLNQK